ncbi:MAG: type II toxin-antitoxin system HicA family toxin [Candidatus Eremiobacteraeota bacterium]|nr:type II toxin-antitoxin system HicA family toxin [Candidatus Eremiobacteraeota bacterium]
MLKTRDVIRAIRAAGWSLVRTTGSHQIYKHPSKPGHVVIPFHGMNHDIDVRTAHSILKKAGLR